MRYFRAKTSESTSKSAKRRSGQDAAPLATDDQPQCSTAGASGTARWQQEQTKDPYRRQRTPMWKRTTKAPPQPARPVDSALDAANAPAAGDVEKSTKLFKPKSKSTTPETVSETLIEPEVELVHREQQTSCTVVQDGTVLEEYGVEDYCVEEPEEVAGVEAPSAARQPVAGPSRPADDEDDDDDDTDTDDTTTDEAVGGAPSTATASTSVPETAVTDRLSAELKALVSLVGMSSGSPVRCTSSSRASATPGEEDKKAEVADGDGEGIRTWQRNFLGRLTRARQRRDIRLNRKEVLSMQLVLETVLKQHMALSREVEAVKANLHWENMEPVSLSRALSRLQAERQEEAAALDKIVACKNKELQTQREQARAFQKQIALLEQSCREKDGDLEKAALGLATVHAMHRKVVQELERQRQEDASEAQNGIRRELDALRNSYAEAEADMSARHKAELAAQLEELRKTMQSELDAISARRDEREAELQARISTLRTDAAAKESRLEMESLRLSRALTQAESQLNHNMTTVEKLQGEVRDQGAAARAAREEAAAKATALAAREAELSSARADQDDVMVLVSKALSDSDADTQQLRDAMEAGRKDHERQLQALRNAADILRSQKDVEALAYSQAVNEKDLQISRMMIDAEGMRAALADAENRLAEAMDVRARVEEANAGLLKTVEAMNRRQEDLTRELHHNFGQLEAQVAEAQHLHNLLAQATRDAEEQRRAYTEACAEVDRQRGLLREQHDVVAERDRLHKALNELHASTETELARLRKELRDHQHNGDEAVKLKKALDKLCQNSAAEAEGLRKAMQDLHDGHVIELGRLQSALHEAASKKKSEAEHFRKALHEKDVQIRDIKDEFAKFRLDQDEVRGDLQARNEGLDRDVSVLKNSVSQMKTAHRDRVSALDKKASDLADQVRRHKQDTDQARAEHRDLLQRAREAERARAQVEQALAKQRLSDQEREGQLNGLVRERDELAADRDGLRMDVEHLVKQKENCQVVVDEKDREIRALRDKIERLEARADGGLQELQQDLLERKEESERLRVELGTALEQREAMVAKVSKLFKVVRHSFDRRTSEKVALEMELQQVRAAARAQLDSAVQGHQAEQDKLMKMMLGKENDMKQLRENLHQYEDHLRSTKEEMDATNSLLKRNIVKLERDAQRRDADLRRRDAEMTRLQGIQADIGKLQLSEQQALERAAKLESTLEASERRMGELELELEVGRSVLKKNTEEHRLKTEKLQQNVEHIRAERDSELTVLKDAVTRLEAELLDRDRQLEQIKAQNSSQLLDMQHALSGRQDETERLTDESERLQRENEALRGKESELRQTIAYLEDGVAEAVKQRDERIATLEEEQRRMAEVMSDTVRRDEQEHLHVAEALQEAARVKERELAALRDAQRRQAADAVEVSRRKDEQIAALEEAVENLRTGLDLDVLRLKDELSGSENERMQLSAQVSMLEAQLQDHISLVSKQIADKDEEIQALTEAKTSALASVERENADLSEENAQLLSIMQRMKKEREADREAREALEAEMQEAIKTTNGALRDQEDRLETLREEAAEAASLRQRLEEAEREMGGLRLAAAEATELQARLNTLETALSRQHKKEQDFLREQLEQVRREAYEAGRKTAEAAARAQQSEAADGRRNPELINLPVEAVKHETVLRSLNQEEGDAGSTERQLRSRQLEVDKLKQTVESLRADLGFQKQLLLTFHEGRAYLGALSDHDSISKSAKFIWGPRNTAELTTLPQDGDHCQAARPHRRPQFELKRTLSEGDTLDLLGGTMTPSDLTLSSINSDLLSTSMTAVP